MNLLVGLFLDFLNHVVLLLLYLFLLLDCRGGCSLQLFFVLSEIFPKRRNLSIKAVGGLAGK